MMRAGTSPYVRLRRALEKRNLEVVRMTAAECPRIGLEDALAILLLIVDLEPERFEPAAVRWAGRLMSAKPTLGLDRAGAVVAELGELVGADRETARRELASVMAEIGEPRLADRLAGATGS